MPIHLHQEITIQKPVEQVFAFVADFSNNAIWQSGIIATETLNGAPLQPGATYRCVNRFWSRRFETQWELKTCAPFSQCHFVFESPTLHGNTRYAFEAVSDGTRLVAEGAAELSQLKLPALLVRPKIRAQMRHDLQQLKRYLEAAPHQRRPA